jgi:Transposase, Mutator family
VPFLAYDAEIRKVVYSTNAIESLHARLRRSVRARGHFPTEQAAMKCLYLAVRSLDPTARGQQRWATRWKPASTPSPSPSKADSETLSTNRAQRGYTVLQTDPEAGIRCTSALVCIRRCRAIVGHLGYLRSPRGRWMCGAWRWTSRTR